MSKRESRVIDAFINCIKHGEFSVDYAITLIEDRARYGWLSDAAINAFYAAIEPAEEVVEAEPIEEEPAEEPTEA